MRSDTNRFWRDAFAISGSITPRISIHVLTVGLIASLITLVAIYVEQLTHVRFSLAVAPFEFAGAVLGLLLVLRTNAGYDRWWEARKLWGGIVNQSRNLAISALTYGPQDQAWQQNFVRLAAVFPHIAKCSLRSEPPSAEVTALIGQSEANQIANSNHMPGYVAMKLSELLRDACDEFDMDRFGFMQVDKERVRLIDHIGGCERILKTPIPRLYAIKIRRFIALFLLTLPFALLHHTISDWLVPIVAMFVAYPLFSLDQIGVELQNPFTQSNLSHLSLDDICATIEENLIDMLSDVNERASTEQSRLP
jgi:putative membrane protein